MEPTKDDIARAEALAEAERNTLTVEVTTSRDGKTEKRLIEVPFTPGNDITAAIQLLGQQRVYNLYLDAAVASVEAEVRRLASGHGKRPSLTDAEVVERMRYYRIGSDGAAREKTLTAIAAIGDPLVRAAALQAAQATEEELPKARKPTEASKVAQKPVQAPKKASGKVEGK